jgi:hypothetical protein
MSSKVRFYYLVIHPQVSLSMDICLDAAKQIRGKPYNTVHTV